MLGLSNSGATVGAVEGDSENTMSNGGAGGGGDRRDDTVRKIVAQFCRKHPVVGVVIERVTAGGTLAATELNMHGVDEVALAVRYSFEFFKAEALDAAFLTIGMIAERRVADLYDGGTVWKQNLADLTHIFAEANVPAKVRLVNTKVLQALRQPYLTFHEFSGLLLGT